MDVKGKILIEASFENKTTIINALIAKIDLPVLSWYDSSSLGLLEKVSEKINSGNNAPNYSTLCSLKPLTWQSNLIGNNINQDIESDLNCNISNMKKNKNQKQFVPCRRVPKVEVWDDTKNKTDSDFSPCSRAGEIVGLDEIALKRKTESTLNQQNSAILEDLDTEKMILLLKQEFSDVLSDELSYDKPILCDPCSISLQPGPKNFPRPCSIAKSIPLFQQESADRCLNHLLKTGIVEKVPHTEKSPRLVWRAFFVQKKNGESRLVCDFSGLNKYIMRHFYGFKSAHELLKSIPIHAKWFAVYDLTSGYHQIPLTPESSRLTTFLIPQGLHRYRRCAMGLSSSGDFFCKITDSCLRSVPNLIKLVDDCLLFGTDLPDLLNKSRIFFETCRKYHICVSPSKMKIGLEVKFCGQLVSHAGVRPCPSNVAAILALEPPNSVPGTRSILGLVQQFRVYIPELSQITEPIKQLLRKNTKYQWTSLQQDSFDKLKEVLSSDLLVKHFDPSLPPLIMTDASYLGISYVLMQIQNEKPALITSGSRSLTKCETSWSATELELLACTYGLLKTEFYTYGSSIVHLQTDHRPLIGLYARNLDEILNKRLQKLRMKVLHIPVQVTYIKGKYNILCDLLSRSPAFVPREYCPNDLQGGKNEQNKQNLVKNEHFESKNPEKEQNCTKTGKNDQKGTKNSKKSHYINDLTKNWSKMSTKNEKRSSASTKDDEICMKKQQRASLDPKQTIGSVHPTRGQKGIYHNNAPGEKHEDENGIGHSSHPYQKLGSQHSPHSQKFQTPASIKNNDLHDYGMNFDTVIVPADKSCFTHNVLIDETLKKNLQLPIVPNTVRILTRSKSKLGGLDQSNMAEAYPSPKDQTIDRMTSTITAGTADKLLQSLLAVSLQDNDYQKILQAIVLRKMYDNLPIFIKSEIPKNVWPRLSIFDTKSIKVLSEHPETTDYANKVYCLFKRARKVALCYNLMEKSSSLSNLEALPNLEKNGLIVLDASKLFIPKIARQDILDKLHSGHTGINKTLNLARHHFWWKNMTQDIKNHISLCTVCTDFSPKVKASPMISTYPKTAAPWQSISIDVFHANGKDYLAICDRFSGFLFCAKLNSTTTYSILKPIKELCKIFGVPMHLRSDGPPNMTSLEFHSWCQENSIHHEISAPGHSESNGHAEAAVKNCKLLLGKCGYNFEEFNKSLAVFNSFPKGTGPSSAELFLGRRIRTNLPLLPGSYNLDTKIAWEGGNKRLKSIKLFQSQKPGTPLASLPIGTRVAVYNYGSKAPRFQSRGIVVRQDRKDETAPVIYVVRLEPGYSDVWKKTSKMPSEIVRRSRLHLIPVSSSDRETEHEAYITEQVGQMQLMENPEEAENNIVRRIQTLSALDLPYYGHQCMVDTDRLSMFKEAKPVFNMCKMLLPMTSEEMDPSLSTQQDIQLPKPVRHTKIRSNPMFGITEPIPDELVKVEKPCGEGDGGGGSSPFEPIIDASFKNGLEWIKNIPPYLDLAFLEAPIALDPSPNVYLMLDGSFSMKKPKQGNESATRNLPTPVASQVSNIPGHAPAPDHVPHTPATKPQIPLPAEKCPISKCEDASSRISFLAVPSNDMEQIGILKFCKDLEVTLQFKDGIVSASDGSPVTYYFDSTSDLKWVAALQNKQ